MRRIDKDEVEDKSLEELDALHNSIDWKDRGNMSIFYHNASLLTNAEIEARRCPDCNKIIGEMTNGACKCEHK